MKGFSVHLKVRKMR